MSTVELRNRLIEKIRKIEDPDLLDEAYRLLYDFEEETEKYKLSEEEKTVVNEARQQILNGKSLTNQESDSDIDEWLNK